MINPKISRKMLSNLNKKNNKMTECVVNILNEHEISLNKVEIKDISCKMLSQILSDEEIISLSALNSYDIDGSALYIDVLLCDDSKIRKLNNEYRNRDTATDVLSFALFADNSESRIMVNDEIYLGEIIISMDTAQKQAHESKKSLKEELYYLLSHGILHLLGFDHPNQESLEYMLKIQDVLSKIYLEQNGKS